MSANVQCIAAGVLIGMLWAIHSRLASACEELRQIKEVLREWSKKP